MRDMICPYCNADIEVNHDDGAGYEENVVHEQQCNNCDKIIGYETTILFSYEAFPLPCKNGEEHKYEKINNVGFYSNTERCTYCGEEKAIDPTLRFNIHKNCWEKQNV